MEFIQRPNLGPAQALAERIMQLQQASTQAIGGAIEGAGSAFGGAMEKRGEVKRRAAELADKSAQEKTAEMVDVDDAVRQAAGALGFSLSDSTTKMHKDIAKALITAAGAKSREEVRAGAKADADAKKASAEAAKDAKKDANDAAKIAQGKMLPPATVLALNEGKTVARMLPDVENAIKQMEGKYGPVTGRIGAANAYDTEAQTFNARMRTASQAFGRFMEGGVLRKEDEIKYEKMFPQISDTDEVKKNKLQIVRRMLAEKYEDDRKTLGESGYDVSGFGGLEIPASLFGTETKAMETGKTNQAKAPASKAGAPASGASAMDSKDILKELLK